MTVLFSRESIVAQTEYVIPKKSGKTFVVKKGRIIRVTGESTADFVVTLYWT